LLLANDKAVEIVGKYNAALENYNSSANNAAIGLKVLQQKQEQYNISLDETNKLQDLFNNPNAASKVSINSRMKKRK
jgi:hypothetical protein